MNQNEIEEIKESIRELLLFRRVIILGIISVLLGYGIYLLVNYYGVGSHVMDWIHLVFRWAHVVLGISWIGASFYFIFLENSLNRTDNLRDELAGNLWAIHGGGFYYVEKYKIAPGELPKKLHWFKYEAYFTWLTGIILLLLVYYFNAKTFMVDPAVATISPATSILIGSGTLIFGWFIYDFLCRTPFIQKKKSFAVLGFLIVTAISFFLSQFLSGRAAFIHVGALIGTIMAGNVFFVIIPAQKAMVKAAKLGQPLNPELGKYAGLRSLHNNYMTLPVIFIMLSNHFPATFGNAFNWAVLAGLTLASVAVRHYINLHEKGQHAAWMIPFAVIAL
ncbi:MAG TPA: urate hydroxylase PuuD, partial [Bacteroidia bacterium]|nr:urate hydroxylase PuuD [Bacteroidia bacterium]